MRSHDMMEIEIDIKKKRVGNFFIASLDSKRAALEDIRSKYWLVFKTYKRKVPFR